MKKKKYDLTSDLISIDKDNILIDNAVNSKAEILENKNTKETKVLLTLSVQEEFRSEFKSWCARHKLNMSEAIIKGFKILKEKHGP